jgi:hypothetical protein
MREEPAKRTDASRKRAQNQRGVDDQLSNVA